MESDTTEERLVRHPLLAAVCAPLHILARRKSPRVAAELTATSGGSRERRLLRATRGSNRPRRVWRHLGRLAESTQRCRLASPRRDVKESLGWRRSFAAWQGSTAGRRSRRTTEGSIRSARTAGSSATFPTTRFTRCKSARSGLASLANAGAGGRARSPKTLNPPVSAADAGTLTHAVRAT
jgi:hypothetical protein